ncbi:hypothetical protein DFJ73DRAFT_773235 [Zopfochytrium polystomum]|nr:hypothetical protein DFJ73DRAFT_773235 [Zopfochytrium polystomum]
MTSTAFPHSSTQEQPFQNPVSAGQPVALHGQQQPTPPPPLPAAFADVHTVKFTVCVDYLLEKRPEAHSDTNSTAARSKSTTTRKNTAAAAAANNTTPRAKKDDEYRSFYVSYALGAHADGKSPNLPPDAQQWTASHDVDVDARFLRDVLGTPLHVAVYENVRVEVEKRVGPGAAESDAVDNAHHSGGGLAVNLADNGLSRREQVRRVKAHSSVRAQDAAEAADEDDAQAAVMAALGMAAAPAPTAQGNNGGWQDLAAAGRPRRSLPPPARSAAGVDDASVAARPRASASAATAGRRSAPPAATDVGAQRAGRAGGGPRGAVGGVASDSERERERGDSPHPHHFHMRHGKSGIGSRVPSVRSLASLSTRATTPEEGTTATVVARDGEGGGGGGPPGLGASRAPQQQQQQPQQRHAGRRSETRPAARGAPPPPPPESRPDTMELLSHVGRTFKDVTFSETVRVADADGSDPSGTSLALKHKVLSEDERVRGRAMSESRLLKLSGDIEVRSGLSAAQQKRETEWSMLQRALLDPETTAKPKKAVKRGRERKPKTKIVIEIQRRLVGAVALELTDLFLGATSAATL